MKIETREHRRRTVQALVETREALDKAMGYQERFRDVGQIAFLEGHAAKLEGMLQDYDNRQDAIEHAYDAVAFGADYPDGSF